MVSFVSVVFLAAAGSVVFRQGVQVTFFTYLSTLGVIEVERHLIQFYSIA